MRKFLLLAVATLFVGTTNAQISKHRPAVKAQSKNKVEQLAVQKKQRFEVMPAKAVKAVRDKSDKLVNLSAIKSNSMKPEFKSYFNVNRRASVLEKYEATGIRRSLGESASWEMTSSTVTTDDEQTVTVLANVLPDIFGFGKDIEVEYSLSDNSIVIEPTLIASFDYEESPTGKGYIFLESSTSEDGSITLELNADGSIAGSYSILYGVYPNEVYNYDEWLTTYDAFSNVKYLIPGTVVAPEVSFEQANLVLFAGLGLNGYSFNNNLAITGAYATTSFVNRTLDAADAWSWVALNGNAEEEILAQDTKRDFNLYLEGNSVAQNVTLIGSYKDAESWPFTFGTGKSVDEDGEDNYTDCIVYGGGSEAEFLLNEETPAIMTRFDPDGDLTFYTNWATPDMAPNSMSKIYLYHERPAAPLYIEGVTLPMANFTATDEFNLKVKIYKCEYTGSKPVLGELIAEGDATPDNINDAFDSGLTAVEFTELYREDEFGLSTTLDYLSLDSEFIVVIEGWDNGTFSGVLGSQDAPLDNARASVWFEKTDEEGYMYSYTSWKTSLFVGFLGATYGYLHTTDATSVQIAREGSEFTIKVNPMFVNQTANESGLRTRIWIDETSDEPDWVEFGITDETYSEDEYSFELTFKVAALPDGVEGRKATIVFCQEGALLPVTIAQGNVELDGIATATMRKNTDSNVYYNLQGVRVANPQKGLYIVNGKKVVVK